MRLTHKGEYPQHWGVLADAVERAAGSRCIRCGHPKGDHPASKEEYFAGEGIELRQGYAIVLMPCDRLCTHEKTQKLRVLTVHHLDGDKANDYWWNLVALCQVCHLQVQARVIPERPWLFEHTEWFKPYVAGYYAFQKGLQLSRWSVEQSLTLCLSYGQPWLHEPELSAAGPRGTTAGSQK